MWSLDARIPVLTEAGVTQGAAVLVAEGSEPPAAAVVEVVPLRVGHAAACACCQGRSPTALALDRLFQARVRGHVPWFDRVVAIGLGPQLADALARDPLCRARYRLG